jgi:hypothetical protein
MALLGHGIAPGLASDLNAIINRFLPARDSELGTLKQMRDELRKEQSSSNPTRLSDEAAERNNELGGLKTTWMRRIARCVRFARERCISNLLKYVSEQLCC